MVRAALCDLSPLWVALGGLGRRFSAQPPILTPRRSAQRAELGAVLDEETSAAQLENHSSHVRAGEWRAVLYGLPRKGDGWTLTS